MVVLGAKGFAKEVLEVLQQQENTNNIFFFDDVSNDIPERLFGIYPVLRTEEDVLKVFERNVHFCLGTGDPQLRYLFNERFTKLGGKVSSIISPKATIGKFNTEVQHGVSIMTGTVLTSDIIIGKGVLLNLNCTVGHNSSIGCYTECSPGVHISGNCQIEEFCQLGTGAVVLPGVKIGKHSIIGAGSVITKDVPAYSVVVGVPGKVIKKIN